MGFKESFKRCFFCDEAIPREQNYLLPSILGSRKKPCMMCLKALMAGKALSIGPKQWTPPNDLKDMECRPN